MTRERSFVPIKRKSTISYGQIFFGIFSLFCLLLLLKNANIAIRSIQDGLALCARTVIPSLFPFMVLSELILSGNLFQKPLERLTHPLQKFFRLSSMGCCALLLGLFCGFPIGARCAVSAYDCGELSREETQHVLLFSGIPSSAFLINAVGISLFESRKLGILLWSATLLSALCTGLLFSTKKQEKEVHSQTEHPLSFPKASGGASLFTSAVTSATRSILLICAYVVFFSTLTGTVELVLTRFSASEITHAILSAALELSGGVSAAASLDNHQLAAILTGATVGWSGISVHCQMLSLCDGTDLSMRPYLKAKVVQTVICAIVTALTSFAIFK